MFAGPIGQRHPHTSARIRSSVEPTFFRWVDLRAEPMPHVDVVLHVRRLVQVQRTGEVLEVDHIGQVLHGKAQNRERAAGRRVDASAEGGDLQRHVGQLVEFEQVRHLRPAQRAAARWAVQRCLVDHRPQLRGVRGGQQSPGGDAEGRHAAPPPPGCCARAGTTARAYSFGLQQSRDELHLVGADHRGGVLHGHVRLEPRRQQILVALPPPWHIGLPGQIEKLLAIGFVGAVEDEKIDQVALLEAVSTQLHPADLRPRRSNQVRSFLSTDPRRLTTFTQLHTNGDPQHGRLDAASHRRLTLRDR